MRPTGTKLIRGRNVSRYRINYDVDEYIAHKWREETAKVNRTQSCIVCQEVTGTVDVRRLHFAPSEPCICVYGHSTNKIVLSQGFSRSFALGLMNSKLMDWYFRKTSTNNHVCGYEIEQLPICGENTPEARSIAVLADAIIAAKKQDPTASTADEERQIDHLVYGLYGLTEDEIAIVEGRDAAARPTKPAARPAKPSAGRQPRKSVMTEDPDLE